MGALGAGDNGIILQPITSIVAGTSATGAGSVLDGGCVHTWHSMQVNASAGTTAGTVVLQGSLDGTNFFNMPGTNSVSTTAAGASGVSVVCVARYIRANITATITNGTVTVFVASSVN